MQPYEQLNDAIHIGDEGMGGPMVGGLDVYGMLLWTTDILSTFTQARAQRYTSPRRLYKRPMASLHSEMSRFFWRLNTEDTVKIWKKYPMHDTALLVIWISFLFWRLWSSIRI